MVVLGLALLSAFIIGRVTIKPITKTVLLKADTFDEAFEEAVTLDENILREGTRWRVWKTLAGHPRNRHPAYSEGYRDGEDRGKVLGYNKARRERCSKTVTRSTVV